MALRLNYMGKKKQVWNPEWDKNRTIIRVSLNQEEKDKVEKKYGKLPSSGEIKDIILHETVKVFSIIRDESKHETIFQLQKIGNNLNQIAWKSNSNNIVDPEEVKKLLLKIDELITKINAN